jgi:hypothetical protein
MVSFLTLRFTGKQPAYGLLFDAQPRNNLTINVFADVNELRSLSTLEPQMLCENEDPFLIKSSSSRQR